jgi:hypothetical protein
MKSSATKQHGQFIVHTHFKAREDLITMPVGIYNAHAEAERGFELGADHVTLKLFVPGGPDVLLLEWRR